MNLMFIQTAMAQETMVPEELGEEKTLSASFDDLLRPTRKKNELFSSSSHSAVKLFNKRTHKE